VGSRQFLVAESSKNLSNIYEVMTLCAKWYSQREEVLICYFPGVLNRDGMWAYTTSGESRGGALGGGEEGGLSPLFWVKKEEITEGKKASRTRKSRPPPHF